MSIHSHDEATDRLPVERGRASEQTLVAQLVATGTRDEECTIYPAEAEGIDLMTRWITAAEGSFVDLEDVR